MLCFIEGDTDANHQSEIHVWCNGEIVRLLTPQEVICAPFLTGDATDDHACPLIDNICATMDMVSGVRIFVMM